MSDLTAEQRGWQMMEVKLKDLPPLAVEFCQHLCHEAGGCMEAFLTAWTVYAQCVKGLKCSDDLYRARPQDIAWFKKRLASP